MMISWYKKSHEDRFAKGRFAKGKIGLHGYYKNNHNGNQHLKRAAKQD
jgi:hypothetical protein